MFLQRTLVLLLAFVALTTARLPPEDLSDDEDFESSEGGSTETDKIYGGKYAPLGHFPYMAVVHRLLEASKFFVCSGSIISKRWVLTAGHCVYGEPSKFLLAFGVVDKDGFRYDRVTGGGVSMVSVSAFVHPDFAQGLNDIGLVQAPRNIPFDVTIQPIRLAGESYASRTYENTAANIFGWGQESHGRPAAQRLSYGLVTVIPVSECRGHWMVNADHICTDATEGQDVCQGDSGGPLVITENDDEPLQIGIVSFGDAGCPSQRPSVYTRVSSYEAWIHKVTGIHFY